MILARIGADPAVERESVLQRVERAFGEPRDGASRGVLLARVPARLLRGKLQR